MNVQLLVYDLSRGLARELAAKLIGFQLDAVYHTSIELNGREYVYDGSIIAIVPGSSHLGQPMQRILLGTTQLPMDVIREYLDSLRSIFMLDAYDLFRHNCNNFTDSFSKFLVGKGIPDFISGMPDAVLESPMVRMLFTQLTQGVGARGCNGSILGLEQSATRSPSDHLSNNKTQLVARQEELLHLLDDAKESCAVIFFTSSTCPPCKALHPVFDQLADELGNDAFLIEIDVTKSKTAPIAQAYSVRATPTFVTFLKGEQENRWTGADAASLKSRVRLLVDMAHSSHPHEKLRLPTFGKLQTEPVLYPKAPPMAKLRAKMGEALAQKAALQSLMRFIETRDVEGAQNAVLPDMNQLSSLIRDSVAEVPSEVLFSLVDVFRCALTDVQVSGFFVEEQEHSTIRCILDSVNQQNDCPYALRLVTLQMACNLFSTPLFENEMLCNAKLRSAMTRLISSSFLDDSHNSVRVAASSLLYNVALSHRRARCRKFKAGKSVAGLLPEDQVELAASVVEAIDQEVKSAEALHGMLLALGQLTYGTDLDGELADLLRALNAQATIAAKSKVFPKEKLVSELADELLGKGLVRP